MADPILVAAEATEDALMAAVLPVIESPECTCEHVDIGVGWQKVTQEHDCQGRAPGAINDAAHLDHADHPRRRRGRHGPLGATLVAAAGQSRPVVVRGLPGILVAARPHGRTRAADRGRSASTVHIGGAW